MDRGIKIQVELIPEHDKKHCAIFVVMKLPKALKQGNDAAISASCAHLANRLPALIEGAPKIRANGCD